MSKPSSSLKATIKDQSGASKTKISEILSKEGQIKSLQLNSALAVHKKPMNG
jgi:type IV pilus assembly protein PilB